MLTKIEKSRNTKIDENSAILIWITNAHECINETKEKKSFVTKLNDRILNITDKSILNRENVSTEKAFEYSTSFKIPTSVSNIQEA